MTQRQTRILVVDGERNIRRTLGMVLATAGYQVDGVSDGEEALIRLGVPYPKRAQGLW